MGVAWDGVIALSRTCGVLTPTLTPCPPLQRGEGNYAAKDVASGEAASASDSPPFQGRGWGRGFGSPPRVGGEATVSNRI